MSARVLCESAWSRYVEGCQSIGELTRREPAVRVVKLDLDKGTHGRSSSCSTAVVQERLSLLAGQGRIGIGEDESDRREEVGFAGAVATDQEIESGPVTLAEC